MRTRVGVLVIKDDTILLLHRWNKGNEYFVIPGGGLEGTESLQETAIRELMEETSLNVKLSDVFLDFVRDIKKNGKETYKERYVVFLSNTFNGNLEFGKSGPEKEKQSEDNKFNLEWVNFSKINDIPLVPEQIKNEILQKLGYNT
jgi:8-oxo-dGTP diphosphatase